MFSWWSKGNKNKRRAKYTLSAKKAYIAQGWLIFLATNQTCFQRFKEHLKRHFCRAVVRFQTQYPACQSECLWPATLCCFSGVCFSEVQEERRCPHWVLHPQHLPLCNPWLILQLSLLSGERLAPFLAQKHFFRGLERTNYSNQSARQATWSWLKVLESHVSLLQHRLHLLWPYLVETRRTLCFPIRRWTIPEIGPRTPVISTLTLNPAICLFLHWHCTCAIYSLRVVGEAISSVLPEFASAALTHRSQTQRSCQMRWTTIAKLVLPSEGLVRRSMSDGFFFAAIFSCFRLTLARCDLSAILAYPHLSDFVQQIQWYVVLP